MGKELTKNKSLIPYNSREYEKRISRLSKKEYQIFKNILFSTQTIDISDHNIKSVFDKLDVNSHSELMAKYSNNYFKEFSDEIIETD